MLLDKAFSVLRIPSGQQNENDFTKLNTSIEQTEKIWKELGLSYTPKFHALLHHALSQMRMFNGFGDMLEDEVEKSHQYGNRFAQRVAKL